MITRRHAAGGTRSEAVYSDCERYRYRLSRTWDDGPSLLFVMLNPSTATELHNDPTIERCERRARHSGYGAFHICNLFAWRETSPAALRKARRPIGPDNTAQLLLAAAKADTILCAWGVHGAHLDQGAKITRALRDAGHSLCHLGLTKDGHPKHPLYLPYSTQPQRWEFDTEPTAMQ
ncbi:MAG: DUF1643 domain-containing protein [Pseudomonadota bacterium]